MAQGRAVPAGGVHRDQLAPERGRCGEVLQPAGCCRAVNQGRQERGAVDEAVLPRFRG